MIHLFDGRKGGVGKSLSTRTVAHYFNQRHFPHVLVDADPKGDVFLTCGGQQIVFSEADSKLYDADQIFDLALSQTVIVNLPANIGEALIGWLERNQILKLGANYGVKVIDWFVCSGHKESVEEVVGSLNYWQGRLQHVVIRNHFQGKDWVTLSQTEPLKSALEKWNPLMVDLPALSRRERDYLENNRVPFSKIQDHREELGILGEMRVQGYLEDAFTSIDSIWSQIESGSTVVSTTVPDATSGAGKRRSKKALPEEAAVQASSEEAVIIEESA